VLDGYPHTSLQAAALADRGFVPDKTILLEASSSLLAERIRYVGQHCFEFFLSLVANPHITANTTSSIQGTGELTLSAGGSVRRLILARQALLSVDKLTSSCHAKTTLKSTSTGVLQHGTNR
jgi:hypothetical protein